MNVVFSEGFNRDLKTLSREDRRRAWDAIEKMIERPTIYGGGLQTKKMKGFDVYEIRASLALRILARIVGDDVCCVRVGAHDATLKAGDKGRLGSIPDVARLRLLGAETDRALEMPPQTAPAPVASRRSGPLAHLSDTELRVRFHVPDHWLPTIRTMETEEQFVAQELEAEIPEAAWYELAKCFPPTPIVSTGAAPTYRVPSLQVARAFENGSIEELEFNLPATSWTIVERAKSGPIFVRGGPGSGKSLLGLYRALHALDRPPMLGRGAPRVLYATFTRTLADDASYKVELLRGSVPAGLEISTVDKLVERFAPKSATTTYEEKLIAESFVAATQGLEQARFEGSFVRTEIEDVIVARAVRTLDDYLAVSRTGRSRRLSQNDRRAVWTTYESWRTWLAAKNLRTLGLARLEALATIEALDDSSRYDLVVVDEVQDLTTTALGVAVGLARGAGPGRDVTLIGDGGQSIYRAGFKWSDVGLRLGGDNVMTLSTCERSTAEIMAFASSLAGRHGEDHDEDHSREASRHGIRPRIVRDFLDREDQRAWLVDDIAQRLATVAARRIAVIARTRNELDKVRSALSAAHVSCVDYGDADFHRRDAVRCVTAHSAKGLEFGEVYVIGADDGSFPLAYHNCPDEERAEKIGVDARLLYVAASRARDRLTILCGIRASPFPTDSLSYADVHSADPV